MILQIFTPINQIDLIDVILEGLAPIAFIFVLVMAFYAKKNNKIFASKGFPVLITGIILGTISVIMDFLTEFYWIEEVYYQIYKSIVAIFQILGLLLFAISLMILFHFTKFLLGEDVKNSDS